MNLFFQPGIQENIHHLNPEESRHCVKSLRRRKGDIIDITDGRGFFYKAVITDADPLLCRFTIESTTKESVREFSVHIAISPLKNSDRIEWFVEKAVEIGIDRITFIDCRHTERAGIKLERVKKIAISAIKQSLKASLPRIDEVVPFNDFVNRALSGDKFIAVVQKDNPLHLMNAARPGSDATVLIGPEGDFSKEELAIATTAGYGAVSLGESRLRTETAGVAACHILNLVNR